MSGDADYMARITQLEEQLMDADSEELEELEAQIIELEAKEAARQRAAKKAASRSPRSPRRRGAKSEEEATPYSMSQIFNDPEAPSAAAPAPPPSRHERIRQSQRRIQRLRGARSPSPPAMAAPIPQGGKSRRKPKSPRSLRGWRKMREPSIHLPQQGELELEWGEVQPEAWGEEEEGERSSGETWLEEHNNDGEEEEQEEDWGSLPPPQPSARPPSPPRFSDGLDDVDDAIDWNTAGGEEARWSVMAAQMERRDSFGGVVDEERLMAAGLPNQHQARPVGLNPGLESVFDDILDTLDEEVSSCLLP